MTRTSAKRKARSARLRENIYKRWRRDSEREAGPGPVLINAKAAHEDGPPPGMMESSVDFVVDVKDEFEIDVKDEPVDSQVPAGHVPIPSGVNRVSDADAGNHLLLSPTEDPLKVKEEPLDGQPETSPPASSQRTSRMAPHRKKPRLARDDVAASAPGTTVIAPGASQQASTGPALAADNKDTSQMKRIRSDEGSPGRAAHVYSRKSFNVSTMASCAKKGRKVCWKTEHIYGLLELSRELPLLWDPEHEHFNKIILKKLKRKEIAEKLKLEFSDLADADLTADDVQAKFAVLKGYFQREVKKIHNTPSGSSGGVWSKWEFFDSCSFMLPQLEWYATTASFTLPPPQKQTYGSGGCDVMNHGHQLSRSRREVFTRVSAKPYASMAKPKPSYRWCFVPGCKSTTFQTPEKRYLTVPKDVRTRKLWCRVAHRDYLTGCGVYCCEDHFNLEEDLENYRYYTTVGRNARLKPGVVPHIFECQGRGLEPCASKRKSLQRKMMLHEILHSKENTIPIPSGTATEDREQYTESVPGTDSSPMKVQGKDEEHVPFTPSAVQHVGTQVKAQESMSPACSEVLKIFIITEEGFEDKIQEAPDSPLPTPLPSMTAASSSSPATTPAPSPVSSDSPSKIPSLPVPQRKNRKVKTDPFDEKCTNVLSTVDELLSTKPQASSIVKGTLHAIHGYLSLLCEDRQKEVAAKLLNVLNSEPPLTLDDTV